MAVGVRITSKPGSDSSPFRTKWRKHAPHLDACLFKALACTLLGYIGHATNTCSCMLCAARSRSGGKEVRRTASETVP